MAKRFKSGEWDLIEAELERDPAHYGMPEGGREESVVLASFNIRKLGSPGSRKREIDFMARFCARCDLVAIQEVQDRLDGLHELKARVDERVSSAGEYGLVVSDITGKTPGKRGMAERLAFLYRRSRVHRADMISDLTVDRSGMLQNLKAGREAIDAAWREHQEKIAAFEAGTRKTKPTFRLPEFLTFARTPHVGAFEVPGKDGKSLRFIAVNAHLIYGSQTERDAEFRALVAWMVNRLKAEKRMVAPNFIRRGDLNLNFDNPDRDRPVTHEFLRGRNKTAFGRAARRVYFPFIDPYPPTGVEHRSNARENQTFDQIAFLRGAKVKFLPTVRWRDGAGKEPDGFDFQVFRFTDLFAKALRGNEVDEGLSDPDRKFIFEHCENSVSDHMPIWVRVPRPGFRPPPPI